MHIDTLQDHVIDSLRSGVLNTVSGVPEGVDAVLLAGLRQRHPDRDILMVLHDEERARRLAGALSFLGVGRRTRLFPAWDCLPYDRVSPHPAVAGVRLALMGDLCERPRDSGGLVVLTTARAMLQRVPPRTAWHGRRRHLCKGARMDPATLFRDLLAMGYSRTSVVMEQGDCAGRGDILDVFPPAMTEPARLDFFGDEITGIRTFDPLSQRSTGLLESLSIDPASEVSLDPASIQRFRDHWREFFGMNALADPVYESAIEGVRTPGMEHWLGLFYHTLDTFPDYLGKDWILVFTGDVEDALRAHLDTVEDHYEHRASGNGNDGVTYHAPPPDELYLSFDDWTAMARTRTAIKLLAYTPDTTSRGVVDAGGLRSRDFSLERMNVRMQLFDSVARHIADEKTKGRRVVVAALGEASQGNLATMLESHGVGDVVRAGEEDWLRMPDTSVPVVVLPLEHGFVTTDLSVVAEQDILGDRITTPRRRRTKRDAERFLLEVSQLAEGDHVVHIDHGIGVFEGLHTITLGGAPHDCLRVHYAGGDALLVPVENIDTLSRYGSHDTRVQLDRLGSAAWQARQARLANRIEEMAGELLKTASERLMQPGPVIRVDEETYTEFCSNFPFQETEDQAKAIGEVFDDLASGRAMDRLVCGDVGFGKTEVALRAALATVLEGYQVAVVAPTTLLARQHHETFVERFRHLPVNIALLSRLVTSGEATSAKKGAAAGIVDIVIGTHALLSRTMSFANLGLLVIDEEQQFGVTHKERLKQIKTNVHVLTLTATPIPRTLQMALSGVRDLSLIVTPPVDRLAIRTFVGTYDSVTVREAIRRERMRGGQTYVVCPRAADLGRMRKDLQKLVPEARIATAHGKLDPDNLESVMTAFYDGRIDVLVTTTIIQSGLDIPNANTMIIHRCDRFGLGQLYQLRGRIGRSRARAYAYITLPPGMKPGKDAMRRLKALSQMDSLGAGFSLASRDLEIRGAGNLLGREQSGHIREVGVELYQQMVEEAVEKVRAEQEGRLRETRHSWSPEVGVGSAVLIPDTWVRDLDVRLVLYRRIAALEDRAGIEDLREELVDRFGDLPEEADNLLRIIAIKGDCRRAGIARLDAGPLGAVVAFHQETFAEPERLISWITDRNGKARMRPDHTLVVTGSWERVKDRLDGAECLASELSAIACGGHETAQHLG